MSIVTFTTDFGSADGYVGAMKGVVLSRSRGATLVDICHDVPPHDVAAGAFALSQAAGHFPPGTIHVAVVDPGVGGPRADVVVVAKNHIFVGPDNGLLTLAAPKPDAVFAIEAAGFRRPVVSPTFHGRDVFAPAAGMLAAGAPPEDAGRLLPGLAPLPAVAPASAATAAKVLHVDRYGNVITSLSPSALPRGHAELKLMLGEGELQQTVQVPLKKTYSDVEPGTAVLYVGSAGLVELAVRNGSAARLFNVGRGTVVHIEAFTA